jgi:allantoicase
MLIAAMAVIFVFTAYATRVRLTPTEITSPRILDTGMCIALQASRAVEVPCSQRHYGVVKSVIVPGERCPLGTEGHYSNDGSHLLCVDPT